ncbi:MAG: helix-turn-helix domain-containing protein [Caulobacterales bacterium]|nr:helix-turn-helix domain-containing protein [Caulobacterales bacterium]
MLAEAESVRASGVLGRSRLMLALFDYLVAASAAGRAPKESEIAHAVFGKAADFGGEHDAVVRVYIHRLRRKLADHSRDLVASGGAAATPRLSLPRGEYRMILGAGAPKPTGSAVKRRPAKGWLAAMLLAVLAANVAAWILLGGGAMSASGRMRASPVWAPFAASRFPLLIVVGDYYIFGESDDGMEVNRLVREYSVNSTEDLDAYLMQHPEKAARYVDLGLSYLPTSSAAAVSRLTGLLGERKPPRVVTASQVTPQMLKSYDIVYLGYLSGIGPLRYTLFSGSRYASGESFDELIDLPTGRHFTSQAALGPVRGGAYRDYGYVSVFEGPVGNRIALVAGTRDIGALAAAEQVTSPAGLKALAAAGGGRRGFEALYEVQGQGDVNLETRLVAVTPRRTPPAWATSAPPPSPR